MRVIVTYAGEQVELAMPDSEVTLGASAANDWVLRYPGVSKRHARARALREGLLVVDLGSKNGLRIEGRRFNEVLLRPGDEVGLGRATLRIETADPSGSILPFDSPSEMQVPREATPSSTERVLAASGAAGAPAALELVRELAGSSGSTATTLHYHIASLRRVLDAQCVVIARRPKQEGLGLSELAGEPPEPAALEALEAATGKRGAVAGPSGRWLLAPSPTREPAWLAALFHPGKRPTGEWAELTLVFVAERLLRPTIVELDEETETHLPGDPLRYPARMIPGESPAIQRLLDDLRTTVGGHGNVLLLGETGTGKELFAQLVHASGAKPGRPFVPCNVTAIPSELLEAELFGIGDRVATGVQGRKGLFEAADGGTLFLDEIGDLPLALQVKLLRVLQEREVRPVGTTQAKPVDARVISASNRDLKQLVAEHKFREDLYWRLAGLVHRIPPLRERPEDIPQLVFGLVPRIAASHHKRIAGLQPSVLTLLAAQPWPGNVRQLESELEWSVLHCASGGVLKESHFRHDTFAARTSTAPGSPSEAADTVSTQGGMDFEMQRLELERREVRAALACSGGRIEAAAQLLGITRQGLRKKIKRLNLE